MAGGAKLLLADDHAMVRHGLRLILDGQPDLEVVAEVGDGLAAVAAVRGGVEVDLAVLDVSMPGLTGLQAAWEIRQIRPDLGVLLLSMHDDEEYFFESLRVGAAGYVLKTAVDRDLVEACRAALRGEPVIFPKAAQALIKDHLARGREPGEAARPRLTPRESQIVKMIAEARTSQEIADALMVSIKTVDTHRANILTKLGMRDRVELTRYAIRRGLIEP
jgi:DNA-binding NarL/FixJ family response regulator